MRASENNAERNASRNERERERENGRVNFRSDCHPLLVRAQASNFLVSGRPPRQLGNSHPNIVPYQLLHARDRRAFVLCVGNEGQFAATCDVIRRPDLAADPRFASNSLRVKHRAELIPELEKALASRSPEGECLQQ